MRKLPFDMLSAAFAALLIACAGCGAGTPPASTTEEATVHGKVIIKGAPARGGRICFDPTSASRPTAPVVSAQIGKDGTYTVRTLVGENRVNVETPETRQDPNLSVPEPFVVKGGDNTLNVTIPRP
jgi:hypothetical protein